MTYILLIIPVLFVIAIYTKKLKEPMIGNCYSDKMPYHDKEVYLINKPLRKKIRIIRKSLEDKATWEHNKMNSYIPKYSKTQNNNLETHPQEFYLTKSNITKSTINPIVTQFDFILPSDKTPDYYMAPKYQYNFTKRFDDKADWPLAPYNSKSTFNHLDAKNYTEYTL